MTWAFPLAVTILLGILALSAYADRIYFEMGKFLAREYAENIDAWEELVEQYGRGILEEWLSRCVQAGDLQDVPVRALARLLIAMLTEASLAIARSAEPAQTRAELGVVLDRMLAGLRP